ncbi:acyltransferase domain-containing protein [Amycolatopsis suaedae]|uniref:Acyltransferase domain-containing protein n=1 Tax=Amycolatopsis suaedae TaxID=2510978 RepID=A0A4Q7JE95_9PSEU|nr:acyltransferase domain-containing protein [Amycolatopsis suaedae]RZQ65809.1 acyltransferase domain-containing protein [Amycolatopsis suaedae]
MTRELRLAAPDTAALGASLADPAARGRTDGPVRLGIVDPTPRKLALAERVIRQGRPWRGRDDIWFSPRPLLPAGRVAFLFPGLEAEFAPRVDDVAAVLGGEVPELSTRGVGRHAAAVLGVARLLDRAVRALGVRPDAVAGHSVGEWAAMVAGGIVAAADFDAMVAGADLDGLRVPGIEFAVLGCPAQRVGPLLAARRDVVLSHDNSPGQTVVCGPAEELRALVDQLRAERVICQLLPFRSGFHTPMLAPYLDAFEAGVPSLPMRPATVPVWSATTAGPFPDDPAAVRELCVRHLVEPVRFRELVLAMYESGIRVFVQMGPGQLGSLVADTLRGRDHLVIAANSPHRPGLATLRRLTTAVWAEGGGISPAVTEFTALLTETAASVAAVLEAVREPVVTVDSEESLEVSTEAMPYLLDHCLAEQRASWPDEADRRPVVPGTTMVEHLAAAALRTAPGRLVTEVTDVRFRQWLEPGPGRRVRLSVRQRLDRRLAVSLGEHADAVVSLGAAYPRPPAAWPQMVGERPPSMPAGELYSQGWLFHGPAFRGLTRTHAVSARGIRGELTVLDAPGALLDSVGHLLGHWLVEYHGERYIAFPVRIDRIRWHHPVPAPGSTVDCEIRFGEVTDSLVRADARLSRRGRTLVTIEGWHDVLFPAGPRVQSVHRGAGRGTLSTRDGADWVLAADLLATAAVRELCLRKYLGTGEREWLDGCPPAERGRVLLELIAVKDAVRGLLWDGGAGEVFPAELRAERSGGGYRVTGRHGRVVPDVVVEVTSGPGQVVARVRGQEETS